MNQLTKQTTQALLDAGCYHVSPDPADDTYLIAFNISGWSMYAAVGEPIILLVSPSGASLAFSFEKSDDVEADIERLKRIIRKVKRDYENAHAHQYHQLSLF